MDSQDRAAFEDIEFLAVFTFGNILQKPWLPPTAGVIFAAKRKLKIKSSDYIIGIDEVNDIKTFFELLLTFYAPIEVILTTWGKLPSEVLNRLSPFKARSSWLRRYFSHENHWHLNVETVNSLIGIFCQDDVINKFTWGLIKGKTPLGLCRAWDDLNVNGSELIEKAVLFKWVEGLKSKKIIESCEIITE